MQSSYWKAAQSSQFVEVKDLRSFAYAATSGGSTPLEQKRVAVNATKSITDRQNDPAQIFSAALMATAVEVLQVLVDAGWVAEVDA